jgi:hypothetical protein
LPVRKTIILLFIAAAAVPLQSQTFKALVPIALLGEVPGAFGSRWRASLTIHNLGETEVRSCGGASIPRPFYPPHMTTAYPVSGLVGAFICIEGSPENVVLSSRVQDLSRQSLTWGTEIPVVREREVRTERLALPDMPTDERFRQTLRIYDWDGNRGEAFRMRILTRAGLVLVDEVLTPLPAPANPLLHPEMPGYTELPWVAGAYPQIMTEDRVTLQISPVNPGVRFWAFLSVTNNETQHVTTITPN